MTVSLGIVGVGHFASFLVEGFRNKCLDIDITLSPRGKKMAETVSQKFNCSIAQSNQEVVDQSDTVIISVRPEMFNDVVSALQFKENQTAISVVSGVKHETIKKLVAPAKGVRALAISSAAINRSPTFMFPDDLEVEEFLSALGPVHIMDNEAKFTAAAAYTALYGWGFKLLDEGAIWGANNGLEKDDALTLMREVIGSVVAMAERDVQKPMDKILESLATKGGITELGFGVLQEQNAFEAWHSALDAVHKRLKENN